MDIGDSVSLSAINLPDGVEISLLVQGEERDQTVVSVTETREMIIEEEVEEVDLEEEEGEEGEEGEAAEGETSEGEEDRKSSDEKDTDSSEGKERKK